MMFTRLFSLTKSGCLAEKESQSHLPAGSVAMQILVHQPQFAVLLLIQVQGTGINSWYRARVCVLEAMERCDIWE